MCARCHEKRNYAAPAPCWRCGGVIFNQPEHFNFRWKHPRKSWWAATRPLFVDMGDRLFEIKKLNASVPCAGWGKYTTRAGFIANSGGGMLL